MSKLGFILYLVFTFSWFTHLTSRVPALGEIRFDMGLIIAIFVLSLLSISNKLSNPDDKTKWAIAALLLYVIFTIPFVEWPGSVVNNLQTWPKYLVFYYFTVTLVGTESRLKIFLWVFLLLQMFRVAEPLYLNITQGYWGSRASMSDWESMDRLAGAPHDLVNPNGLAFVILTIFPFLYYFRPLSLLTNAIFFAVTPVLIHALILTGSRSGMLGMGVCLFAIIYNSKRRSLSLVAIVPVAFITLISMSGDFKDRYVSLFDPTAKNAGTVGGRIEHMNDDLELSLRKPIFGHGLGTSTEASSHFSGRYQISHNLYTEIAIELGFIGLAIFVFYIINIYRNVLLTSRRIDPSLPNTFLTSFQKGLLCWLVMNTFFSMASYGLSNYEWYLFGGLSVALLVIYNDHIQAADSAKTSRPEKIPDKKRHFRIFRTHHLSV